MGPSLSEDVQYIQLYNPRHVLLHWYCAPFILLYGVWLYIWAAVYGFGDYFEASMISAAAIGIVQVLVALFCFWSVDVRCHATCCRVKNIADAKLVKVVPTPNNGYAELIPLQRQEAPDGSLQPCFIFQKTKYIYDSEERKQFQAVHFPVAEHIGFYQKGSGYETEEDVQTATKHYGLNKVEMSIPKFMELFQERATAPFFVFQVFCVFLWCLDEYWYYSLFTLAMLIVFEATLVGQQLRNLSSIRDMGAKPYDVMVYRGRKWKTIRSDNLLPGDLLSVGRSTVDFVVPCDVLLLRGSCIVDEAMLTGESVPQMKEPVEELEASTNLDVDTHGRLHVIFGGTKVVQHTAPPKSTPGIRPSDNGCLAYVLRTGFHTSQGKLLRTILYSVKRVTANNLETFGFIIFLLCFAVAAASYVWIKGTEDPKRNRYKLFLECTLILTSVVPPELPIELSLAVNQSLLALTKLGVYCTEPFRIPFAGKVDYCCFDKTGTLTSDNLVVNGVAGLRGDIKELTFIQDAPPKTQQVLASCHSLAQLDDSLVGDPLEKAVLAAIDWSLTRGDIVMPRHGKRLSLRIIHRFHFNSFLKRMTAIATVQVPGEMGTPHLATVKGAAEVLRPMFSELPVNYDKVHRHFSRRGARVLALGYKELGELNSQQLRELTRDEAESGLTFAGFVVISCPLKPDSKAIIKAITDSSHHVAMITGDNPLTACHVSKELCITKHPVLQLLKGENDWAWHTLDESQQFDVWPQGSIRQVVADHQLCLTGPAISFLQSQPGHLHSTLLEDILPHVSVFARVAPKQKELVVTTLKKQGFFTLMCGDGTNDVGALKHAHVGVALLANPPPKSKPKSEKKSVESSVDKPDGKPTEENKGALKMLDGPGPRQRRKTGPSGAAEKNRQRLQEMLSEIDEMEKASIVKLGDASIASPFTSRYNSPISIGHVLRQGRCTLVTTLQMFKILALNALILAYTQSVLYLDGIKFSDSQATLQGILLAGCFLFISRSKPLDKLSTQRPLPNIFNAYTILTVLMQFAIHLISLIYLTSEAKALSPPSEEKYVDLEKKFSPSPLNSAVYLIAVSMQVSTFAVNYQGHPFMASLRENKPLLYSLLLSAASVALLAAGLLPDAAQQFELVEFPAEFQQKLMITLVADFVLAFVVDRVLKWLLGRASLRQPL